MAVQLTWCLPKAFIIACVPPFRDLLLLFKFEPYAPVKNQLPFSQSIYLALAVGTMSIMSSKLGKRPFLVVFSLPFPFPHSFFLPSPLFSMKLQDKEESSLLQVFRDMNMELNVAKCSLHREDSLQSKVNARKLPYESHDILTSSNNLMYDPILPFLSLE